ncbi:MAG: B12-binding domain-containing protein [Planctomycetota bacterium]
MLPLDRQCADSIDGVSRALAEWTVSLLYERHPEFERRYGADGRLLWRGEIANRIQHLAEAIATARPALFEHSVEWARAAFVARDMDPADLVLGLQALEETLRAELPGQIATRAAGLVTGAIARLERAPKTKAGDGGLSTSHLKHEGVDTARAGLYLKHLLDRHQAHAVEVLLEAARAGRTVPQIYETVIGPALAEVGRMWHMREVRVADEHYVTAATQSAMAVLRMRLPRTETNGLRVLATSVGGELHDLGIRMVADLLESEGWSVDCLGANMPTADLVESLRGDDGEIQYHLVALSASTSLSMRAIADAVAAIREATGGEVPVMVGGAPFSLVPDLWKVVGADGCATCATDAVRVAAELAR